MDSSSNEKVSEDEITPEVSLPTTTQRPCNGEIDRWWKKRKNDPITSTRFLDKKRAKGEIDAEENNGRDTARPCHLKPVETTSDPIITEPSDATGDEATIERRCKPRRHHHHHRRRHHHHHHTEEDLEELQVMREQRRQNRRLYRQWMRENGGRSSTTVAPDVGVDTVTSIP